MPLGWLHEALHIRCNHRPRNDLKGWTVFSNCTTVLAFNFANWSPIDNQENKRKFCFLFFWLNNYQYVRALQFNFELWNCSFFLMEYEIFVFLCCFISIVYVTYIIVLYNYKRSLVSIPFNTVIITYLLRQAMYLHKINNAGTHI